MVEEWGCVGLDEILFPTPTEPKYKTRQLFDIP